MNSTQRHEVPTPGCRCDACANYAKRQLVCIMAGLPDPPKAWEPIKDAPNEVEMQEVTARYQHLNSFEPVEDPLA